MFHMMSCFNLKPGITIQSFSLSLGLFSEHMKALKLVDSVGPVGKRQSDTPMDTDEERDHQFFFVTTFADREQCDHSYNYILEHHAAGDAVHDGVYLKVENPVFICYEDIPTHSSD